MKPIIAAVAIAATAVWLSASPALAAAPPKPTLEREIPPPKGYSRSALPADSFGAWLRNLGLRPNGTQVRLFNGALKRNQTAHHRVVDLSVGTRNLQQCADAIMRLRSEYLWDRGAAAQITFKFTNGTPVGWKKWRAGWRTRVRGNKVSWVKSAAPSRSRATFAGYLRAVMMYAGTASLSRELSKGTADKLGPGDAFIQGGYPGHAVLVLDLAVSAQGETVVLLGQSYMPAQDFHVLKNLQDPGISPWYRVSDLKRGGIKTPEWKPFTSKDIRRF